MCSVYIHACVYCVYTHFYQCSIFKMLATVCETFILSFVLPMVSRCVPADVVPLMRDAIYHGAAKTDLFVQEAYSMFEIPFDAFTFMGPSKKLFLSCVMCLDNCIMVSD